MNRQEAQAITARIRYWVNTCPVDDVLAAYEGRAWEALDYPTWGDWCDGELGGFKLPVPQRQSLVSELAERGMSNRSIAEVVGASEGTVRNDRKSTAQNYAVPERTLGQDGKTRPAKREPRPTITEEQIRDSILPSATQVRAENLASSIKVMEGVGDILTMLSRFESLCAAAALAAQEIEASGPYGDPLWVDKLNRSSESLTSAQVSIMQAVAEVNDDTYTE